MTAITQNFKKNQTTAINFFNSSTAPFLRLRLIYGALQIVLLLLLEVSNHYCAFSDLKNIEDHWLSF